MTFIVFLEQNILKLCIILEADHKLSRKYKFATQLQDIYCIFKPKIFKIRLILEADKLHRI